LLSKKDKTDVERETNTRTYVKKNNCYLSKGSQEPELSTKQTGEEKGQKNKKTGIGVFKTGISGGKMLAPYGGAGGLRLSRKGVKYRVKRGTVTYSEQKGWGFCGGTFAFNRELILKYSWGGNT